MSATPEFTTRDVLQQVDRRLTHLEELTLQHELRNDQAHSAMNERNDRAHASLDMKIDRNLPLDHHPAFRILDDDDVRHLLK